MSSHLALQEPEHRRRTFLLLSGFAAGILALSLGLAEGAFGVYAVLLVGPLFGFVLTLPKRWELDGNEFRKCRPQREAGHVRLSEVRRIETTPRVKGGFDLWLVTAHGYRVEAPSEPGARGDAFRHQVFQRVPAYVLARLEDPLVRELVASAARSATSEASD